MKLLKHFLKIYQFLIVLHLIAPIIIIQITLSKSQYIRIDISPYVSNFKADVKVNNKKVFPSYANEPYLGFRGEPGEIEIIIHNNLTSLRDIFYSNLDDSIKIKTSGTYITDLGNLFYGQNSLKSVDLSEFDISKVTNFENMFENCNNLKEVKFGNYKTSMFVLAYLLSIYQFLILHK